jgi:hypothetical protein
MGQRTPALMSRSLASNQLFAKPRGDRAAGYISFSQNRRDRYPVAVTPRRNSLCRRNSLRDWYFGEVVKSRLTHKFRRSYVPSCNQLGFLNSDSFGAALKRACKAIPTNVAIRIEGYSCPISASAVVSDRAMR